MNSPGEFTQFVLWVRLVSSPGEFTWPVAQSQMNSDMFFLVFVERRIKLLWLKETYGDLISDNYHISIRIHIYIELHCWTDLSKSSCGKKASTYLFVRDTWKPHFVMATKCVLNHISISIKFIWKSWMATTSIWNHILGRIYKFW